MQAVAGYALASGYFYPLETIGRLKKVQIIQQQDPFEAWAVRHYHTWQPGTNRILWTSCDPISLSLDILLEPVFLNCCAKAAQFADWVITKV